MVDRFEDVYSFNIEGNFHKQLEALRNEVNASEAAWSQLRGSITRGAKFFDQLGRGAEKAAKGQKELVKGLNDLRPEMEALNTSARTTTLAYNSLVRAQNALNISRAVELQALRQAKNDRDPNIIAARAEARALRTITKALEDVTTKRRLHQLAAEAGIQLTADGAKVFNAEAVAAERAAKAVQELAVAEALRNRGLDPKGAPLPQPIQGPLTQEASRLGLAQQDALKTEQDAGLAARKAQTKAYAKSLQEVTQTWNKQTGVLKLTRDGFAEVGKSASSANTVVSQFLFTFRRLVGVMAVFTVARNVARGFTQMVTGAIGFNEQLERNRVGMAGLIAASGQVLSAEGRRIPIAEQLTAAQGLANRQMEELRKSAIQTVATYEDLADAFSQSIAPGISAGLDLDNIREMTVVISQAAAGLGLAQNQLSEEIRALFQGTITPRNTRIATALGITNEDVRRAKELGQLGTFLKDRFEAISKSGAKLANTFAGQVNAASDAFKQLLAESSKPLFGQLKQGLKDFNTRVFKDIETKPIIDPNALKLFDQLFKGIAQGVRNIRVAFSDLDIQGFADTFGLVGRLIGGAATIISNGLAAAFKIASPLLTVFNAIAASMLSIVSLVKAVDVKLLGLGSSLAFSYAKVVAMVYVFKKMQALVRAIRIGWQLGAIAQTANSVIAGGMLIQVNGIAKAVAKLRASVTLLSRPLLIAAGAVFLIDQGLKQLGVDGGLIGVLGDAFVYISDQIDGAVNRLLGFKDETESLTDDSALIANGFKEIKDEAQRLADTVRTDLVSSTAVFADQVAALRFTPEGAETLRTLSNIFLESAKVLDDAKKKLRNTFQDEAAATAGLANVRLRNVDERGVDLQSKRFDLLKKIQLREEQIQRLRAQAQADPLDPEAPFRAPNTLQLEKQTRDLKQELVDLEATIGIQRAEDERLEGLINKSLVERKDLLKTIAEIETGDLQRRGIALKLAAEEATVRAESARPDLQIDAIRERAVADLLRLGDEGRVRVLDAIVARRKEELANAERQQRVALETAKFEKIREEFQKVNADWAVSAAAAATVYLDKLEQQAALQDELSAATQARLKEEERLAQLRETGSIGDGFNETIRKLANEKDSYFLIGENLAQGLFSGIPQTLGTIVTNSLRDGFSSAEVAEAFRNLAFNTIGQFVQDLATKALSSLFVETVDPAKTTAELAAVESASLTMDAAAVSSAGIVTASLNSGATAIAEAGVAAASSIIAAVSFAKSIAIASKVSQATALVTGAVGGRVPVQGFALGGAAQRRRAGIDPRDTVPAMLRPGEWVIRPEAVRHYGDRLFALLNGRKIDRAALPHITARAPNISTPKSGGFATGGPVSAKTGSDRRGSSTQVVLQFNDEQTMDRALAAGSGSMVRFTRTKRSQMRAALGLEAN